MLQALRDRATEKFGVICNPPPQHQMTRSFKPLGQTGIGRQPADRITTRACSPAARSGPGNEARLCLSADTTAPTSARAVASTESPSVLGVALDPVAEEKQDPQGDAENENY